VRIPKRSKTKAEGSLRQRLRPDQSQVRPSNSQTFSYHAQRSDQSTNTGRQFRKEILSPAAKNAAQFWMQRFGLGILLIVGVICFISAVTLSSDVKIQQLGPINRSSLFHNQAAYQASAKALINNSLLNHNKITINTTQISNKLLQAYPELSSVNVALPLLSHRPIIYISYTEPALIVHNQAGSFVLDTAGKVLAPTSGEAVNLGLPSVTDASGFQLALNNQVLSSGDVRFIQTVVAGLRAKHIAISNMTLPPAANELDVSIGVKQYYVKFNLHNATPDLQVGTFLATQKRLQGEGITPAKYIDVRVDGRAYYQ
jgi:hypothetical protein